MSKPDTLAVRATPAAKHVGSRNVFAKTGLRYFLENFGDHFVVPDLGPCGPWRMKIPGAGRSGMLGAQLHPAKLVIASLFASQGLPNLPKWIFEVGTSGKRQMLIPSRFSDLGSLTLMLNLYRGAANAAAQAHAASGCLFSCRLQFFSLCAMPSPVCEARWVGLGFKATIVKSGLGRAIAATRVAISLPMLASIPRTQTVSSVITIVLSSRSTPPPSVATPTYTTTTTTITTATTARTA